MPIDVEPVRRVVEPEVVGLDEPKVPFWKGILARAAVSAGVAFFGLVLCGIGLLMTITIVGAAVGIPLMVGGLLICALSVFVFFGFGSGRQIHIRSPRGPAPF